MVHRSELAEVVRTESPRNESVQQDLDHLGLQHADFQTNRGRLPIVQFRSKLFEACPHETGPSFDFEPECTDRAQTSITVSERPSRVDLLRILPKSARTKWYVRKQTKKKMTNITTVYTCDILRVDIASGITARPKFGSLALNQIPYRALHMSPRRN